MADTSGPLWPLQHVASSVKLPGNLKIQAPCARRLHRCFRGHDWSRNLRAVPAGKVSFSKIGFAEVKHFCRANLNFALVDGRDPYSRRYERLISLDRAANTSQLTVCHRIDGPDCRLMRLCCGIARYILRCGVRLPNASISATVGISCQFAMI